MKNKIAHLFSVLVAVVLFLGAICVNASGDTTAQSVIDSIISYKLKESGASSVQSFIDGTLTQNAGKSAEWYIISLCQYKDYNFSKYETALTRYLSKNEVGSASTAQKYALTLIGIGSDDNYIQKTVDESIGKQGIMSWVYGLNLLNNGYKSVQYSLADVKNKLLSLQLSDGGWSVMGKKGEIDATAMAIHALAPYYKNDGNIKNAVDNALGFLSKNQLDTGDFSSYGVNNAESTAQVLTALSSLGIDCKTDNRFIKNGNDLFDGILLYRLSNGSFSHKIGGSFNDTSTVQALYSMISYSRMKSGKSGFYILDKRILPTNSKSTATTATTATTVKSTVKSTTDTTTVPTSTTVSSITDAPTTSTTTAVDTTTAFTTIETQSDIQVTPTDINENGGGYKLYTCLIILIAGIVACIILFILKKATAKNLILTAIIATVGIAFIFFTNFESVQTHYNSPTVKQNAVGTVMLSIRCDQVEGNGIILDTAEFEIEHGDTVYDVLMQATSENKIQLETSGVGDSVYVEGIANVYEFDYGDLSGWMYFVNGNSPSVSCGEYTLSKGDKIEWVYTLNMGEDVKPY